MLITCHCLLQIDNDSVTNNNKQQQLETLYISEEGELGARPGSDVAVATQQHHDDVTAQQQHSLDTTPLSAQDTSSDVACGVADNTIQVSQHISDTQTSNQQHPGGDDVSLETPTADVMASVSFDSAQLKFKDTSTSGLSEPSTPLTQNQQPAEMSVEEFMAPVCVVSAECSVPDVTAAEPATDFSQHPGDEVVEFVREPTPPPPVELDDECAPFEIETPTESDDVLRPGAGSGLQLQTAAFDDLIGNLKDIAGERCDISDTENGVDALLEQPVASSDDHSGAHSVGLTSERGDVICEMHTIADDLVAEVMSRVLENVPHVYNTYGDPQQSRVRDPQPSDVSDPMQSDVGDPQQSHVSDPQPIDVSDPQQSDVSEPKQCGVPDPMHSDISEPLQSDVSDPQPSHVSETQQIHVSETQPSDVSETQPSDVSETQQSHISEPDQSDVSDLQQSDINGLQQGDVSDLQQNDISNLQQSGVGDPQQTDVGDIPQIDVSDLQQIDVIGPQQSDVSVSQQSDVHASMHSDISEPLQSDVSHPQQSDASYPQQSDVGDTQQTDVSDSQQSDIRDPQQSDVIDSCRIDVGESQANDVVEKPQQSNVGDPEQTDGEPRQSEVSDPQQSDVGDSRQCDIADSQHNDVDDLWESDVDDPLPKYVRHRRQSDVDDPWQYDVSDRRQSDVDDPLHSDVDSPRQSDVDNPQQRVEASLPLDSHATIGSCVVPPNTPQVYDADSCDQVTGDVMNHHVDEPSDASAEATAPTCDAPSSRDNKTKYAVTYHNLTEQESSDGVCVTVAGIEPTGPVEIARYDASDDEYEYVEIMEVVEVSDDDSQGAAAAAGAVDEERGVTLDKSQAARADDHDDVIQVNGSAESTPGSAVNGAKCGN